MLAEHQQDLHPARHQIGGAVKNNPAEVLNFVRASMKGQQYFAQHRGESIEIISNYLGIKDRSLATEAYDLQVSRLGGASYFDDAWMRGAIDFTKKSMSLTKDVAPSQALGRGKG